MKHIKAKLMVIGHSLAPRCKNIKKNKVCISTISILAGIGLFTVIGSLWGVLQILTDIFRYTMLNLMVIGGYAQKARKIREKN